MLKQLFLLTTGNAKAHTRLTVDGTVQKGNKDMAQTIPLGRAGKYGTLEVETERFSAEIHDYIYAYGLRQVLNDAMAEKKAEDGSALPDDEIVAKAQKRLDNLYAGVLRTRGESEPFDPFEAECYRLAKANIEADFRKAGKMKDVPKGTKDRLLFVVNRELAAQGKAAVPDVATLVAKYLNGPRGADVKKNARAILKARESDADDLLGSVGL